VDTSVAVKWYVERGESDAKQARRIRELFQEGQCILQAPQLLLFEIANALLLSRRLKATAVLEALNHVRELDIDLQPFSWATLAKAVEIASSCGVTVYDSYFLALASESDGILVTADEVFLRRTRSYRNVVSLAALRLPE
jgi:predicted nucleic acid-binding protein